MDSEDAAVVRSRRLVAAVLALLALAVYARSLGGGFVYDAVTQIGEDDFLHTPRNLIDVLTLRVMARDVLDFNRPVQLLSLMIDALVWGRRPFGFHLTNVLLHAGCVVLLFGRLVRWLERAGRPSLFPAALAAALFAVHPLGVEAVAEPSYREELLVGLFLLLALRLCERAPTWPRTAGLVACALGAIAAKETGVVVICGIAAARWWGQSTYGDRLRRDAPSRPPPSLRAGGGGLGDAPSRARPSLRAGGGGLGDGPSRARPSLRSGGGGLGAASRGRSSLRAGVGLLMSIGVVAGFVWARFALAPVGSAVFRHEATYVGGSFVRAMWQQPRIWALYLRHLVWPGGLCADYGMASIAGIPLAVAIPIVALVVATQVLAARRSPLMRLSLVLFWGALLPASNLFPMFRPAADRYLYVPMIGVACAVAWGLAVTWARRPLRWIAGALIVVLACVSIARQAVWASELALWTDTLAKNPRSTTAVDNLAWAHLDAGHLDEAEALFRRAVATHDPDPWVGLALALARRGRLDDAGRALDRAVALDPIYADPDALARTLRLTRAQLQELRDLIARLPSRRPRP